MNIDFPLHFDQRGATARTGYADHVRDMIEELLFTDHGERVNRPDFGCGLRQLVFAPNSPELAATVEFTARAALTQWLGDVIDIRTLDVTSDDATLTVALSYALRATGAAETATFTRGVA
jgi:Bacteriophage baseplate protein W